VIGFSPEFTVAIIAKNRFVAFVDILGVAQHTRDEASSNNYVRAIYSVVSTILKEKGFFELQHVRGNHLVEVEIGRPADKNAKLTAVSDALVVSVPERSIANKIHGRSRLLQIMSILETISNLQSSLAAIGLLSRGGLACGPLVHTRDVIVGLGLVKAHHIESKRALFPRTVIDNDIIGMLLKDEIPNAILGFRSRIAHAISKDEDGEYYVNYFGFQPLSGGVLHQRENLERMYAEKEAAIAGAPDQRAVEKLNWFHRYVRESLNSYSDPIPYLQCNEGTDFDKRYPRVFENLRHMVDNYLKHGSYKDPFGEK
jgi:hypothetical protein